MSTVSEDLLKLIRDSKNLAEQLPQYAAADKILLFPKMLDALEIFSRRQNNVESIISLRYKLHETVKEFSSLLFSIQNEVQNWTVGEREKMKIGAALRKILIAAAEMEEITKERRA